MEDYGRLVEVPEGREVLVRIPRQSGLEWRAQDNLPIGVPRARRTASDSEFRWSTHGKAGIQPLSLLRDSPPGEFHATLQVVPPVVLDAQTFESGSSVRAMEGQEIVLRLPIRPGSAKQWWIKESGLPLAGVGSGLPSETEPHGVRISNRSIEMRWSTRGDFPRVGIQPIALSYCRAADLGSADVDYAFVVEVQPREVVVTEAMHGLPVMLLSGQRLVVKLPEVPGFQWDMENSGHLATPSMHTVVNGQREVTWAITDLMAGQDSRTEWVLRRISDAAAERIMALHVMVEAVPNQVVVDGTGEGATVTVRPGQVLVVRLPTETGQFWTPRRASAAMGPPTSKLTLSGNPGRTLFGWNVPSDLARGGTEWIHFDLWHFGEDLGPGTLESSFRLDVIVAPPEGE